MTRTLFQLGLVAVLGLGVVLTPVNAANSTKNTKKPTGTESVVATLHQAKLLLETAVHDYDGHRAKAVGELHHAIHELSPNHKGAGKSDKATTAPGENQAQSDMQMKEALKLLGGLADQVPANTKAATHIQTAVNELNIALKIK